MTISSEPTPSHALAQRLSDEIAAKTFNAKVIPNQRDMSDHLEKLLRVCRADGEEFAIVYTKDKFQVWSSVETEERPGLKVKTYTAGKTRHHNLWCMKKLRGPNKKTGTLGVCAWQLKFSTLEDARTFIMYSS